MPCLNRTETIMIAVPKVDSGSTEKLTISEGVVLVLAPTGRDAEGASLLLRKADIYCHICPSFQSLLELLDENTGIVLIAEEAFRDETIHQLLEYLEAQPIWSDLPLIVLTRAFSSNRLSSRSPLTRLSEIIGNIMFLERPLQALTLISAVRTALKARQRQYQSRDYLIERERVAQSLLESQQKLEQSNRELEHFAAIASHDLQAPLRKVLIFSTLLEEDLGSSFSKEAGDYISRMKKSINHMQQLITDLLNLSRITSQPKAYKDVNLSEVLQEAMDDLVAVRRDVNGQIDIQNKTNASVFGDADQLRQLFQNLIENGLKFHRKNVPPMIKISIEITHPHCRISVADNGIGFNEIYADRIFETFQRLHGQAEYSGTGIGLSIVYKIVQRHGGHISVTSTLGVGSTFVISLPTSSEL